MSAKEQLVTALGNKVGFEVINDHDSSNQVRLFGRVRQPRMPGWLNVIRDLLLAAADNPWNLDISRQYFLRGNKLFFGWRVILQGQDIAQHMTQVCKIIRAVDVSTGKELDEVPLHANPNRNAWRNGRGAQPMEKAVVGPMAKARMGM